MSELPPLPNFPEVGSLMAAFRWAPSTEKAVEYRNQIIAAIRRTAREEALEEAARQAEDHVRLGVHPVCTAAAIRSLK